MKTTKLAIATLVVLSNLTLAETITVKIPDVKKIVEKEDGSFKVKCVNKSKGTISKEETNICVFSKRNNKNRCEDQSVWTINDAAEYICS